MQSTQNLEQEFLDFLFEIHYERVNLWKSENEKRFGQAVKNQRRKNQEAEADIAYTSPPRDFLITLLVYNSLQVFIVIDLTSVHKQYYNGLKI